MTLSLCDQVAERIALGESLAELSDHAQTCSSCSPLVAMRGRLGASHHAVDPGLGFSARMTVGAQHLIAVRRRRRVAAGLAASVASGAFAVFLVTRPPNEPAVQPEVAAVPPMHEPSPPEEPATPTTDEDLAALVQMADVHRASRLSARWGHIKKPLRPYKQLIEGPLAEGETP
jgi:hypothetical protein